jgi:hypothetical protein
VDQAEGAFSHSRLSRFTVPFPTPALRRMCRVLFQSAASHPIARSFGWLFPRYEGGGKLWRYRHRWIVKRANTWFDPFGRLMLQLPINVRPLSGLPSLTLWCCL